MTSPSTSLFMFALFLTAVANLMCKHQKWPHLMQVLNLFSLKM